MKRFPNLVAVGIGWVAGSALLFVSIFVFNALNLRNNRGQQWTEESFSRLEFHVRVVNYLFFPIIIIVASLTAALIVRQRKPLYGVLAAIPFLLIFFTINSLNVTYLLVGCAYGIAAAVVGTLASLRAN
jgi:hypothetical protein